MASNKNRQPAPRGKANPNRTKKAPAAKPAPQPKKRKVQEEAAPGSILMRMSLLLCTGLVVVGLLFASVNGGSQYVGLPEEDNTKATPTPPVATVDPMQNVEGSELTPIPPSASPEGGTEGSTTTEQPTP